MPYRIDIATSHIAPCTFVPSKAAPGKTLSVNDDGSSLVVLPDGTERPTSEPAGSPNWDSPWTWGTVTDGFLFYRSQQGSNPGAPRAYRMLS